MINLQTFNKWLVLKDVFPISVLILPWGGGVSSIIPKFGNLRSSGRSKESKIGKFHVILLFSSRRLKLTKREWIPKVRRSSILTVNAWSRILSGRRQVVVTQQIKQSLMAAVLCRPITCTLEKRFKIFEKDKFRMLESFRRIRMDPSQQHWLPRAVTNVKNA